MAAAWNGVSGSGGNAPGYRVGTRTHVGLVRERNEDHLGVSQTAHGLLVVVCDGMGGHRGGQRASALAVEIVTRHVESGVGSVETLLREAVALANGAILAEAGASAELEGMGTTLVAALLRGASATIINVGDSRAYLLHGDTLKQITTDHSLVAEMVARGEITEEEAAVHPRRNVITRALGGRSGGEPDVYRRELVPGDVILLSSDGLHGMIDDAAIRDALLLTADPARACDDLVERALAAGGADNVSVIAARFGEGADVPEPVTDPVALREEPATRGPRGLAMIVGVGLGAILFMALLVAFWFYALSPDLDRDASRRDSLRVDTAAAPLDSAAMDSAARAHSTAPGFRYDSAGTRDTLYAPNPDTIRVGDTIDW